MPVIRNAESMSFLDIEKKLAELSTKARDSSLSTEDMTGGTFTISNGGERADICVYMFVF